MPAKQAAPLAGGSDGLAKFESLDINLGDFGSGGPAVHERPAALIETLRDRILSR